MKKLSKVIISSLIFIFLFFVLEVYVYHREFKNAGWGKPMSYSFFNPDIESSDVSQMGRPLECLPSQKNPILLFGCSFAFGIYLEDEQTFGYKLSKILDRAVINRSVGGGSMAHMLYQTENEDFYKQVPKCKDVIYVIIDDTTRRLYVDTFLVTLPYFNIHYKKRKNDLVLVEYKNPFVNLFKSLYLYKFFQHKYVEYYLKNPENADEISELELMYFLNTRENLEKNWKEKVNFTIVFYNNFYLGSSVETEEKLVQKLKENGFNVIKVSDITDESIMQGMYIIPNDGHPTETAWNLLTPLIAKKL